jgi:ribosome production factor 2
VDKLLEIVVCLTIDQHKRIYMRVYQTRAEGPNLLQDDGKIVMEELGPEAELTVRRTMFAEAELWKQATHVPKPKKKKHDKNVKYDELGNRRGKLYMDKQDLGHLQTKKRKFITKKTVQEAGPKLKAENEFAA